MPFHRKPERFIALKKTIVFFNLKLNDLPVFPCLSLVVLEGICIKAKTVCSRVFFHERHVGKHKSKQLTSSISGFDILILTGEKIEMRQGIKL